MEQKSYTWHYRANSGSGKNPNKSTAPRQRKINTSHAKSQHPAPNRYVPKKPTTTRPKAKSAPPSARKARPAKRKKSSAAFGKFLVLLGCVFTIGFGVWSCKDTLADLLSKSVNLPVATGGDDISSAGSCVIRSGEDMLPPEIAQTLKQWFVASFTATAHLSEPDFQGLYAKDSTATESRLLDETVLRYISKVRSLQPVDLSLTGFEIGLTITDCSTDENGNYIVTLMEDDQVQFACLDGQTSSSCDIYNQFVISPDGHILSHDKTEDGFTLIQELYQNQHSGSAQQTLDQIFNSLVETAQQNINTVNSQRSSYATDIQTIESSAPTVDHSYNRSQAVEYARQWVGTTAVVRNSQWGMYDDYGGNCNNFTSQCLHAGGIPMDIYGSDTQQWKWYGEQSNTQNAEVGRSTSWSGVDEFYTYVTQNSGYGLVAQTDINIFAAQPGDVIQYGAEGDWKHSVLVMDTLKDENGQPLDLLIASNTTDRINWPMSAYAYTDIRLIHVLGYNT